MPRMCDLLARESRVCVRAKVSNFEPQSSILWTSSSLYFQLAIEIVFQLISWLIHLLSIVFSQHTQMRFTKLNHDHRIPLIQISQRLLIPYSTESRFQGNHILPSRSSLLFHIWFLSFPVVEIHRIIFFCFLGTISSL